MKLNDAQNFAEHIARLTHDNLNLEARIQIAEKIEQKDYVEKFQKLFSKQAELGYLESQDSKLMNDTTDEVLTFIAMSFGKEVHDTIYHAL